MKKFIYQLTDFLKFVSIFTIVVMAAVLIAGGDNEHEIGLIITGVAIGWLANSVCDGLETILKKKTELKEYQTRFHDIHDRAQKLPELRDVLGWRLALSAQVIAQVENKVISESKAVDILDATLEIVEFELSKAEKQKENK